MRTCLPNTVHDWEKMLKRVYETQGPSGFAKYQYSISSILQLKKDGTPLGKMLEYCKDIPDPKNVLIDAICQIALNEDLEIKTRVAAAAALRALIPKIKNYPGLRGASLIGAMQEVLESTREKALQEAFNDTIEAANRKIQECPRAYAVRI